MEKTWEQRRKRIFEIIEVGNDLDYISRGYDFANAFAIILNLAVSILYTFSELREQYGTFLYILEEITVAAFCIDYVLRVWTAKFLYPELTERHAVQKYVFSFTGIVDFTAFPDFFSHHIDGTFGTIRT